MKTGNNENSLKEEIGLRFKKMREEINKSQKELAIELKVYQSSISQIESGITFPSITTLNYLMDRYHISSNWLINGAGTMKIQDHDIVSLIRKGENLDGRYINLLKQMQHPDIEKLIFARLMEAEVYIKNIKPENKS
jgi:transcriptional regulator with XRE-family HTH domain